jgi:hemoglobin-like flavoprotein
LTAALARTLVNQFAQLAGDTLVACPSPIRRYPDMTPDQILLVRSSWPFIAANADALTLHFYAHLFEIDNSAAQLFAGVDMMSQRKKVAQALAVVVKVLDDPDQLLPAVAALGKRHANYGVEHHHFDSIAEALIAALAAILGPRFTPPLQAAWTEAYALVASIMRRALIRPALPAANGQA